MAAFEADGSLRWADSHGADLESHEAGLAIAALADGGLAVGGYTEGPVDLSGGILPGAGRFANMILARFSGAGEQRWSAGFDAPGVESVQSIAAAPDGLVCFAGTFGPTVTLPTGTHVSQGDTDAVIGCLPAAE